MEDCRRGIQEFYNAIAQQFADEWYANESLLPTLKNFMSLLKPNPRILDLGCGAGYESMRLHKLGAEVVGIDYSEEPIKIARQKNPDCRFELMDFRDLSDSLGKFDGILAAASIIHVNDNDLRMIFRKMKKVIKPNGLVMLIFIEGQGISAERSLIERDGVQYYRTFYLHSKNQLNEVARNAGFNYYNEFELDKSLSSFGWKCYLYQSL